MASLNKVMLIGTTGKDCELRYSANGFATASVSLAVNSFKKGQNGERQEETEWFNVVLLGDTAEKLSQYITKGKPLYVEGRIQTRSWENDQGVKQYRTEIVANTIQLLGSRDEGGKRDDNGGRQTRPAGNQRRPQYDDIDDLPFE